MSRRRVESVGGSPGAVLRLALAFALIHSVLASRQAKDVARMGLGVRYRNGLYRFLFVVKSVLLTGWATWKFVRMPDRELYEVPPPWSYLMVFGQVAPLALLFSGARVIGFTEVSGLRPAFEFLGGHSPRPEPEAQGPPPGQDGELVVEGAFRLHRHPANWGFVPFFLLFPKMTVNRAVLSVLATLYLILGSVHEEYRMKRAHGEAYDRYRSRVPFLLPARRAPRKGAS